MILKLPKIISDSEKIKIVESFRNGLSLEDLAAEYGVKKFTIKKHLKKILSDFEYENISELKKKEISNQEFIENQAEKSARFEDDGILNTENKFSESFTKEHDFLEIPPLEHHFEIESRVEVTSIPLIDFPLPDNIFMITDKNNELEVSLLKDFPEYGFLSEADQNRKIIKLFSSKKSAGSIFGKNQKVIKIPNGKVLKMASPFLLEKGITRIIYDDYLLSI